MPCKIINTSKAPAAIGPYSQAIMLNNTIYFSGQIGLDPETMKLVDGFENQVHQVLKNLNAITQNAGGNLKYFAKLTVFLTDLGNFDKLNDIMQQYFTPPYPTRSVIEVKGLPKGAQVEIEGIIVLPS